MATLEQIEAALRKADAAGNVEDARALAKAYREMSAQQNAAAPEPASPPQQSEPAVAAAPNPQASSLPGWMGDFQNTLTATKAGGDHGVTAGFGDEIIAAPFGLFDEIGRAVTGQGFDFGRGYTQALDKLRGIEKDSAALNPGANMAGQVAGSLALGGTAAKGGLTLMNGAKPTVTSMATRGAAEGAGWGALYGAGEGESMRDKLDKALSGAALGGALGGATGVVAGKVASRAAAKSQPTSAAPKAESKAAFDAAERTGAVVHQPVVQILSDDIRMLAQSEGLISPTGRVTTAFPKVNDALAQLDDFAQGPMTIGQAKTVRKVLGKTASSIDREEARFGAMMLDRFDDFMENLKPGHFAAGDGKEAINQWMKARSAYHVFKKAQTIEDAIEKARSKGKSLFTGSGFENALRREFDKLLSNPKRIRGFTDAEKAALKKVVDGAPISNAMRLLGRLAPTGAVPFLASAGIGHSVGGPVGAAALMGVGYGGRAAATKATAGRANRALQTVLARGGKPSVPLLSPGGQSFMGGLLAVEGGQVPPALDYQPSMIPLPVRRQTAQ